MGRREEEEDPGAAGKSRSLQAALLAVSILFLHVLLTPAAAEILVTWEPSQPQTRGNLTLTPEGPPRTVLSCSWYRGWTTAKKKLIVSSSLFRHHKGESHTGSETAGPNCSLHIRNLTVLDSGNYTVKKKGFIRLEIGHAYVEISDPSLLTSSPGIISGIVIGLLLAMTAGIGALLYFFLRGRNHDSCWSFRPDGPILAPAPPVSSLYRSTGTSVSANEYVMSSTREEPWTQVESGNAFDTGHAYQKLQVQHGSQDVYYDLKKPYPLPPGSIPF